MQSQLFAVKAKVYCSHGNMRTQQKGSLLSQKYTSILTSCAAQNQWSICQKKRCRFCGFYQILENCANTAHEQRNYSTTFALKLHYFSFTFLFFYLLHNSFIIVLCTLLFIRIYYFSAC